MQASVPCAGFETLSLPQTHRTCAATWVLLLSCIYLLPKVSMVGCCRFRDFELVTQPPYLRSYVGAPVVLANGHRVGVM